MRCEMCAYCLSLVIIFFPLYYFIIIIIIIIIIYYAFIQSDLQMRTL